MDIEAVGAAVALMLIFESLVPFANPRSARKLWLQAAQIPDGTLRTLGAVGIAAGLVLLTWVRNG
ncbi:MAG: DUF2065 domain-containing protein [Gammaproteobacteria bacterium]